VAIAMALSTSSVASAVTAVPNSSPAAESAASSVVAAFAATHSIPVVNSTDRATYAAQNAAALAYWKAAPVAEMVAQ
jgi:hypothetical protein